MENQNQSLGPEEPRRVPKSRTARNLVLAGAGAAMLVLGALSAPVAWQTLAASAMPAPKTLAAPIAQAGSSLAEDQEILTALYERVGPSVVSIQTEGSGMAAELPDIPGFELPPDMPQQGQGSGWIFDDEGHIVTNHHVVDGADKITVIFSNDMWADAELVADDPQADLAVIKVTPPEGFDWRPLALADEASLKVGNIAVALGNPFGLANTMTTGIVSALDRGFPVGGFGTNRYTLPDVVQTDAAINPGNSGGPLLDLAGNVVGVNFAIESQTRQNSGVGYAIPVSIVKRVIPELIKDGKFEYAYLGLAGNTITPDLAEQLGLKDNNLGVYVSDVVPGGPAEKGGVEGGSETVTAEDGREFQKGGDIVKAIDGQEVRSFEDLVSFLVTQASPGQEVTLSVERNGALQDLKVTLGERPAQPVVSAPEGQPGQINARAAIAIAQQAVEEEGSLSGDIQEKVATPEERDGKSVWVVELSTDSQKATVVVDADSGDVLDITVE